MREIFFRNLVEREIEKLAPTPACEVIAGLFRSSSRSSVPFLLNREENEYRRRARWEQTAQRSRNDETQKGERLLAVTLFFFLLFFSPHLFFPTPTSTTPKTLHTQRPLPLRAHPGPHRRAPLSRGARHLRWRGRPGGENHRGARLESRHKDRCRVFEQRRRRKLRVFFSTSRDGRRPSLPPRGCLHRYDSGQSVSFLAWTFC